MPNDPVKVMSELEQAIEQGKYTKVTTNQGAILYCRIVPVFAQTAVHKRIPAPPLPRVEVKSASGDSVETHLALPGTPEHDAYMQAKKDHKREFGLALQRFTITYGVVAWRPAPGEPVQTVPPADWEFPPTLREYGVEPLDGPDYRAQYILYELVLTDEDLINVEAAILPSPPVTKEDVTAALAPFDLSTEGSPSSTDNPLRQEKGQE
jgi:hypothetical protein